MHAEENHGFIDIVFSCGYLLRITSNGCFSKVLGFLIKNKYLLYFSLDHIGRSILFVLS